MSARSITAIMTSEATTVIKLTARSTSPDVKKCLVSDTSVVTRETMSARCRFSTRATGKEVDVRDQSLSRLECVSFSGPLDKQFSDSSKARPDQEQRY